MEKTIFLAQRRARRRAGRAHRPLPDLDHGAAISTGCASGPAGLIVGREPGLRHGLAGASGVAPALPDRTGTGGVTVSDLASTNGTILAGRRIERPTRLHNGSHIAVGTFLLRYEQRDEREVEEEERLTGELREAVEYVRAILPEPIATGQVQTEWWYVPSSELGGDAFGYQFLDETSLAGFLIDVTGHGIGAGMHAANVANVLRRRALQGVDFYDPGKVAEAPEHDVPHGGPQRPYVDRVVLRLRPAERMLRYSAAGHHPSFLLAL